MVYLHPLLRIPSDSAHKPENVYSFLLSIGTNAPSVKSSLAGTLFESRNRRGIKYAPSILKCRSKCRWIYSCRCQREQASRTEILEKRRDDGLRVSRYDLSVLLCLYPIKRRLYSNSTFFRVPFNLKSCPRERNCSSSSAPPTINIIARYPIAGQATIKTNTNAHSLLFQDEITNRDSEVSPQVATTSPGLACNISLASQLASLMRRYSPPNFRRTLRTAQLRRCRSTRIRCGELLPHIDADVHLTSCVVRPSKGNLVRSPSPVQGCRVSRVQRNFPRNTCTRQRLRLLVHASSSLPPISRQSMYLHYPMPWLTASLPAFPEQTWSLRPSSYFHPPRPPYFNASVHSWSLTRT